MKNVLLLFRNLNIDRKPVSAVRALKEAMLYVSARVGKDDDSLAAKPHKVLWLADFESHKQRGVSVTGSVYVRTPKGPSPQKYQEARRQLFAEGKARPFRCKLAGYEQHGMYARRDHGGVLSGADLRYLDDAIRKFESMTVAESEQRCFEMSQIWQTVGLGEVIPYQTVNGDFSSSDTDERSSDSSLSKTGRLQSAA